MKLPHIWNWVGSILFVQFGLRPENGFGFPLRFHLELRKLRSRERRLTCGTGG